VSGGARVKLGAGLRMALTGGSSSPSSSFAAKVIHIILFAMSCGKASIKLIKPSHSRMKGGHNRRGGNITSYIYIHIIPFTQCHKPLGMVYEVRMDKPSRCRRGLCAKGQEKNGFTGFQNWVARRGHGRATSRLTEVPLFWPCVWLPITFSGG
jgi:hypothetical protein